MNFKSSNNILLLSFKPMKNSFAFFNDLHNKKKNKCIINLIPIISHFRFLNAYNFPSYN